jgi:hypothetical protein
MEAKCSFETSADFQRNTHHYTVEHKRLHNLTLVFSLYATKGVLIRRIISFSFKLLFKRVLLLTIAFPRIIGMNRDLVAQC